MIIVHVGIVSNDRHTIQGHTHANVINLSRKLFWKLEENVITTLRHNAEARTNIGAVH